VVALLFPLQLLSFFPLIETDFFFIFFYQSLPCGGSSFSVVTFVFFLFD
jgi:hypothetical protein